MNIKDTKELRSLGSRDVNRHLFDVTFHNTTMYLSFHHALCDGGGFKPFLESLLYYYCSYRYKKDEKIPGIRLSEDALLEKEASDPFDHEYEIDPDYKSPETEKEGYHLKENDLPQDTMNYRYEVLIKDEDFMRLVKENKSTPSIMACLLQSNAIEELDPSNQSIICNVACDMRKMLHYENTFKNCVTSIPLVLRNDLKNLSLQEQSQDLRNQMKLLRNEQRAKRSANMIYGLSNKIANIESFKEKKEALSYFDTLAFDTYSISYIGKINLGYNEEHIESIHLFNQANEGLNIHMIDAAGYFSIDFKQSFPSDKYVQGFIKQLQKYNVPYTVSKRIDYTVPTDKIQQIARV